MSSTPGEAPQPEPSTDSGSGVAREPEPTSASHAQLPPGAALFDNQAFFQWVGTKNPFYAISAVLVLWGLWRSFGGEADERAWALMGCLAGYTLLLAVTACFLVRFLQVWDDARTVLLLVVLMFLATSVTFDHVLMTDRPGVGMVCYGLGLVLAIAISEGLLRGIHLKLPQLYRRPYYLILAVFYLYPIYVSFFADREMPTSEPWLWALFGFSSAAGLAFLTLLPAIYRGPAYVQDNGSPWPWPLYPWSLFFILGITVPARAILSCWSLHAVHSAHFDRLVFGPYFLIPFGYCVAWLTLEMGVSWGKANLTRFALGLPVVMVFLGLAGHTPNDPIYRNLRVLTTSVGSYSAYGSVRREPDPIYNAFLGHFFDRLGADPLFYTVALAALFYAFAAWRRIARAEVGLTLALTAFAFVATNTLIEGLFLPPLAGPLLLPAALQLGLAISRRDVWHWTVVGTYLCAAASLALPLPEDLDGMRYGLFVQGMAFLLLAVGIFFREEVGVLLRRVGVLSVGILSIFVMQQATLMPEEVRPYVPIAYPLAMGLTLALYGHFLRDSWALGMGAFVLGAWLFKFGWMFYRTIRGLLKGFDYLVAGLGFFGVAVLVSLAKSGALRRLFKAASAQPPIASRRPEP